MSGSPKEGKVPQGVSRRDILKGAAASVAGFGAAALLGARAEAAQPSSVPEIKYLERFPDIPFNPLQIEGEPIEDTLESGPRGYWFHAANGQRVEIVVGELNQQRDYVAPSLYDEAGNMLAASLSTRLEGTLLKTGDYFLIVNKREDTPRDNTGFRLEVRDAMEHGIQVSYMMYPDQKPAATTNEVRFPPEILPVLVSRAFGVILDFNEDTYARPNNWEIKVYAQKGDPEQVTAPRMNLPEEDSVNEVPYLEDWRDHQRVIIFPARKRPEGTIQSATLRGKLEMLKEWPHGSHISVVVYNRETDVRWVMRFFTLGVDK